MNDNFKTNSFFGSEKIWKILGKLAPPIMLAQLIQSLYNIVDSYFVGLYSETGLTALSIIYPIQLLIMAFGIGTGVGINTLMARFYGEKSIIKAEETAGTGIVLAIFNWSVMAVLSFIFMKPYVQVSAESQETIYQAFIYGRIVCIGSLGLFLESTWSKIHQAKGNMKRTMIAQVSGAIINII